MAPSSGIERTDNDVLLGRGAATRDHFGNRQFRNLVIQYRDAYAAAPSWERKTKIATEIQDILQRLSPPGRFLKPSPIGENAWIEVDSKKTVRKIKQALRERCKSTQEGEEGLMAVTTTSGGGSKPTEVSPQVTMPLSLLGIPFPAPATPWNTAPLPSLSMYGGLFSTPYLQNNHNNILLQNSLPIYQVQQAQEICRRISLGEAGLSSLLQTSPEQSMGQPTPSSGVHSNSSNYCSRTVSDFNPSTGKTVSSDVDNDDQQKPSSIHGEQPSARRKQYSHAAASTEVHDDDAINGIPQEAPDTDVQLNSEDVAAAQFLFSALTESNQTTWNDLEREREQLTKEDKGVAMADMFGALCEIHPKRKRARRGLNQSVDPVDSSIKELKRELEAIPRYSKLALSEAQEAASPTEFSDRRLKLFLQRDGMDAKLAAQRIVTYWEERRALFGPEKFHLPMTLSGAMRDDQEVVARGILFLVPGLDMSGRQVGVYVQRLHTRDNYDTRSLLRVMWFYHELAALHPNAANGTVRFMWPVGASMWDVDLEFEFTATNLELTALPVRICANHVCCLPRLISTFVTPIGLAQVDKDTRSRTVLHNVPQDQIVSKLLDYGIPPHMIPNEMGGASKYKHDEWTPKLKRLLDEKLEAGFEEFDWAEL